MLLVVNTCGGIYMFKQLTACDGATCDKQFALTEDYMVHAVLLIMIPASVFVFLLIVFVKLICFLLADRKKTRSLATFQHSHGEKPYGQFEDENSEDVEAVEAVVSVYFKIMDRVIYDNSVPCPPFMSTQSQCKLCLRYFQQGEEVMKIPICDHIFHITCLRKWLVDWQKCPTCE